MSVGIIIPNIWKNVQNHQPGIHYIMGLSENSVSHIPMDYKLSPCSPLKFLFVGIPYFQTNPYEHILTYQ